MKHPDSIHKLFFLQTADGGPDIDDAICEDKTLMTVQVYTVDLVSDSTSGLNLSVQLMRMLRMTEGRAVKRVSYHAIRDMETNPDGSIGTIRIELEPKES